MDYLAGIKKKLSPFAKRNRIARAFTNVFSPKGELFEDQKVVLKELNTFCYINATHHSDDATCIARNAGRREVYNWIVSHIDYDPFDLDQLMRQMKEMENE